MDKTYLSSKSRTRIQDYIKYNKITQAELAEKIGLSESTLSRYLQGKTNKLGDGNIIRIAKALNVSTDFLLGETEIPDRKNYNIEELGLSEKSAELLYTGKLDSHTLNRLLENPRFPQLLLLLARYEDETMTTGMNAMNDVLTFSRSLLIGQAKNYPEDKSAALTVAQKVQLLKTPPVTADTNTIQTLFMQIVREMKQGTDSRIEGRKTVTAETMEKLRANLAKGKDSFNLHDLTPEDIVNAIIETAASEELPAESLFGLKAEMMKMFVPPEEPHDNE